MAATATNSDEIPPLRPPRDLIPPTFWEQHSAAIILLSILCLIVLGFALWLILRPKAPIIIPPEIQARQALEALRGKSEDGAVLSRVSQILRRYLAAAFGLPPEEMTTTEFCAALTASTRIGPQLSIPIVEFLRQSDEIKFSPAAHTKPQSAVDQSLAFIEQAQNRLSQLQQGSVVGPSRT